jgi:hypothetical protein
VIGLSYTIEAAHPKRERFERFPSLYSVGHLSTGEAFGGSRSQRAAALRGGESTQ